MTLHSLDVEGRVSQKFPTLDRHTQQEIVELVKALAEELYEMNTEEVATKIFEKMKDEGMTAAIPLGQDQLAVLETLVKKYIDEERAQQKKDLQEILNNAGIKSG